MRHRGPDDAGEWWSPDGCVGLGHRRLAIIDLTPSGHQPMASANGSVLIAFNGEIYNFVDLRNELTAEGHTFRTRSDTEVVLAAYRQWGTDCVVRLNGMFAFAIYNSVSRELFIARDRAGEKPLFYALDRGTLRFASELKALMVDPAMSRRIDLEALDCYLAMGFVPGAGCMLKGVRKLSPAHALVFKLASAELRVWRYWALPAPATMITAPDDAVERTVLDELEVLLQDAVRRQLAADVPVGVLLSGGVDSSLVTAMAARAVPHVKSFTIRFPGHGAFDETEHARLIARHFGTEHVELEADASTVELLPLLARQFDEPIVDSSMIPTFLLSQLVRKYCTVALGGDGGDELFAGYHHYNRLLWMQRNLGWIPQRVQRFAHAAADTLLPVGLRGRNWFQGLGTDLQNSLPLVASCFDRGTRRLLMQGQKAWQLNAECVREKRIPVAVGLLERATRMDFENYMAEDILVKVDRASMLNSLEVRAPLLDHRLIEFAFGRVPASLKATTHTRKVLLKKLATRVLPPEFDQHRKQGFSIPLMSWLESGSWLNFFKDVLLDSADGFFDRKTVARLLAGQARGLRNSERLFGLVMFELWRREYKIQI
jgi:asparagine synthase (glutamine-hydrolysing)